MTQFLTQFAVEETAQKTGLGVLGINPIGLLLQLVTFAILYFLLRKFAFKAIVAKLEERRRTIDAGVRLGHEMAEEKEKLDEEVSKLLHKARQDADGVVQTARQEASTLLKEAEDRARTKTEALVNEAHLKIADDIKRARGNLKQEMLVLVAEATEAVLDEKVDAGKDSALIKRSLQKADRS